MASNQMLVLFTLTGSLQCSTHADPDCILDGEYPIIDTRNQSWLVNRVLLRFTGPVAPTPYTGPPLQFTVTQWHFRRGYDSSGGAIQAAFKGTLILQLCRFTDNIARFGGGAIEAGRRGTTLLYACSFLQ